MIEVNPADFGLVPPEPKEREVTLLDDTKLKFAPGTSDQEISAYIYKNHPETVPTPGLYNFSKSDTETKRKVKLFDGTELDYGADTTDKEIEEDLLDKYPEVFEEPEEPSTGFFAGISRGGDILQQLGLSGLSSIAEYAGFDDASEYLDFQADRQRRQLALQPGAVESFKDAEGFGENFAYARNIIGETLPLSGGILATSLLGAKTGAKVGSFLGVPGVVAGTAGGALAGFIGSAVFGAGEVREEIKDELRKEGLPDRNTSAEELAGGAAIGALDLAGTLVTFGPIIGKFVRKFGKEAVDEELVNIKLAPDKKTLEKTQRSVALGVAKAGGAAVVTEGLTESGQEFIAAVTTDAALGREPRSIEELEERLIEAGLAGMVSGGFFGSLSGGVSTIIENNQIKNEEIGERTEEEQEQADKAGETKTPSVLAENNTVTFIDKDGTEQNGTVTFIDRGKGDIIKNVVIAPNQGYGREVEVGPENILNENSKSRSPYKSLKVRELEQQLKIAHDQGNLGETIRLRKAIENQQKIEKYKLNHRKGNSVADVDEAKYVLRERGVFQEGLTDEVYIRRANESRRSEMRIKEQNLKAERQRYKEEDSITADKFLKSLGGIADINKFTKEDLYKELGITLDTSKKKVNAIVNNYIDEGILSQDGENYKINKLPEKFEMMGLEASKDFLEIINPEAYRDLINSNNTKRIISVANDQLQRKFKNIVGPELIRGQTKLDDFQKIMGTANLLKDPKFRSLSKKQKKEVFDQFAKNFDPNNQKLTSILGAVWNSKKKQYEILGGFEGKTVGKLSTFKTNLTYTPEGAKKPIRLDVTQDEINAGEATRGEQTITIESENVQRNTKGEKIAGRDIVNFAGITTRKRGARQIAPGTIVRGQMDKGAIISSNLNQRPTPEEFDHTKDTFNVVKLIDTFDLDGNRLIFAADQIKHDYAMGTTPLEIPKGQKIDTKEINKIKAKLRRTIKKENERYKKLAAARGRSLGVDYDQYTRSEAMEKEFGFKAAYFDENLGDKPGTEKDIIKFLRKMAKTFGLKKEEFNALSLNGELTISFSKPGMALGTYSPSQKLIQSGAYGYKSQDYPLESTTIHEWVHAFDHHLGTRFGHKFGSFEKEALKAAENYEGSTVGYTAEVKQWATIEKILAAKGGGMLTGGAFKPDATINPNAKKAWKKIIQFINKSKFKEASTKKDLKAGTYYLSNPWELIARMFEVAVSKSMGVAGKEQAHKQSQYPQGTELEQAQILVNDLFQSLVKDNVVNETTKQTMTVFKAQTEAVPKVNMKLKANVAELQQLVKKLLGTDQAIKFIPTTITTPEYSSVTREDPVDGTYLRGITYGDIAEVSLAFEYPDFTAVHEAFHIAENVGMIPQKDLDLLNSSPEALKKIIREAQANNAPTLLVSDEVLFTDPRETRAYALEAYRYMDQITKGNVDSSFSKPIATLFKKIVNFFKKLQNWFNGQGFNSVEDILNNFLEGSYASDQALFRQTRDKVADATNPQFALQGTMFTEAQDIKFGNDNFRNITQIDNQYKFVNELKQKIKNMDDVVVNMQHLNLIERNIYHPSALADKYPDTFGQLYSAVTTQRQLAQQIEGRALRFANEFFELDVNSESYKKLSKVFEVTDYYKGVLPKKNADGTMTLQGVTPIPTRENSGINFREPTILNAKETQIYEGVREALDGIYDQTMLSFLAALNVKYPGKTFSFNEAIDILRKQADRSRAEGKEEEARLRDQGVDILTQAQRDRHAGYFPRSRGGIEGVLVTDTNGENVHFETFNEKPFRFGREPVVDEKQKKAKLDLLKEKFPASAGFKITPKKNLGKDKKDFVNMLSVLETVETYLGSPESKKELKKDYKGVLKVLRDRTVAGGFLKFVRTRSDKDITGYINERNQSTYHRDSLLNYIQSGSTFAAAVQSAPLINTTQKYLRDLATAGKISTNIVDYGENYIKYIREPQDEFRGAKFASFFTFMGFNFSSAVLNLTQLIQATIPLLMSLGGPSSAITFGGAAKDALKLSTISDVNNYFFDPEKIKNAKLPKDEKDMLYNFFQKGILTPIRNIDAGFTFDREIEQKLMNKGVTGRGTIKAIRTGTLMSGALFGGVEQYNRITSALTFYRMYKKSKKFRDRLNSYKENTKYQNVANLNANIAAEMGVMETQFLMGKENRPNIARITGGLGAFGPIATQFLTFPFQFVEFMGKGMVKLLRGKTPQEKYIGGVMFGNTALAVVLFSGILGLPFADTMRELFRRLSKMFTDVEVDIELVMRQSLTEMFSGITSPENAAILADSALRGSARNALGFDLSKRAGFGELLGYDVMNGKLLALAGPIGGVVDDAVSGIAEGIKDGKPMKAFKSVLPLGIQNVINASTTLRTEGFQTQTGRTILPPEDVTFGMLFSQGIGFAPTRVAKERELTRAGRYITNRDKQLKERYTKRIVDAMAASYYYRNNGDNKAAKKQRDKIKKLKKEIVEYNKGKPIHLRIKIQPETLRNRFNVETKGINSRASLRYVPKSDRKARMKLKEIYFGEE